MAIQVLLREVLQLLYANDAYWSRCGGPGRRPGMTTSELLVELDARYPQTHWTNLLLEGILLAGIKKGAIKAHVAGQITLCAVRGPDPAMLGPRTFYGNNAMLIHNPANRVFADIAPRHICRPRWYV